MGWRKEEGKEDRPSGWQNERSKGGRVGRKEGWKERRTEEKKSSHYPFLLDSGEKHSPLSVTLW